jgi:hypothetical protein
VCQIPLTYTDTPELAIKYYNLKLIFKYVVLTPQKIWFIRYKGQSVRAVVLVPFYSEVHKNK